MEDLEYYNNLTISSDLGGLKECLDLAKDIQLRVNLDSDKGFALQTVLLEAANNAIMHGNKFNKDLKALIKVKVNKERIFIEVEDQGEGFNLDKIPSPIEKGNIGLENGRGIFFIRQFSDSFSTIGKGNIVNIIINR
jgi:serine/threonine-protein kinase RsbW